MNFKQYNHLSGYQTENWFREFSAVQDIKGSQPLSPGKLVRLLHQEIPVRLNNALIDIRKFFPDGVEMVNQAILSKSEPHIAQESKIPFSNFLMDYAASTDDMIVLPDASGQPIKIAIDVTVNPIQEDAKIRKIRGLPEKRDRNGENRNKNIGKVRKALGIEKHLVVILDSDRDKLPSHQFLLEQLNEFAQGPSQISSLNLKNLAREFTIGGDHERLSQGLEQASNQQKVETIATRSIQERHHFRYAAQILMQDKILHQFETISQAENVALDFTNRAVKQNPDYQIFWAVQDITLRYGKEKDGDLLVDGASRIFKRVGGRFEVWAKDGRDKIYSAKSYRSASDRLTSEEKSKFREIFHKSQKQIQQQSRQRTRGPRR